MNGRKLAELDVPGLADDLKLLTHGQEDLVSRLILEDRIWEAFETRLFLQNLQSGDTVADIGANIGYYTVLASKVVGNNGAVLAFEPEADNFTLLEENIALNTLENVKAFNAGLGDSNTDIPLYINTSNRGDHRNFNKGESDTIQTVNILKGDEVLPEHVDFIKIDTQGYEAHILRGLEKTLTNNQQHLNMIVEFWPYALAGNGSSAEELIDYISQYSFTPSIIDHINHTLLPSDWQSLKTMVAKELTVEKQGFVNLWLSPDF